MNITVLPYFKSPTIVIFKLLKQFKSLLLKQKLYSKSLKLCVGCSFVPLPAFIIIFLRNQNFQKYHYHYG